MVWGRWALLLVPLLAGACRNYAQGVGANDEVNRAHAFLYGRFVFDDAGGGHNLSAGLVFGCSDGSRYTIGIESGREIQVIEIRPARCSFDEVLFADHRGRVRERMYPPPAMGRTINYRPGTAYYLGDFLLRTSREISWKAFWREHPWGWDFQPLEGRYTTTTADMKQLFPRVAALPTEETHLLAARPPPPGDGVAARPGEPPLTPERVADLARFIKRTYRSPAACEGSCGLGRCLPFRGESGAAMVCVTRCDTDADCPQGLVCNCPNDQRAGDACQPIAPARNMARICLPPTSAPGSD